MHRTVFDKFCRSLILGMLLPGFLLGPTTGAALAQQSDAVQFSGQATVLRATVLGITTTVSDTGPLPSSGGAVQKSLLSASVPGILTADVFHATAVGQGKQSSAEAAVADATLTAAGHTISASFLAAQATATCTPSGPSVSGNSEIAELVIDGQPITLSGAPNQTIPLPAPAGGEIIINEQDSSVSGNSGSMTVNALHITVPGVADVVVSSAHADITCAGQPNCTGKDFVTGGGWINGPSGAKANFGVAGGIRNGSFWGHLEYIDHGNGLKVHGTGVIGYSIVGPTTREIDGTAEVNGQTGFTYKVIVADNGEPGRNDTFSITLSPPPNGYPGASGTLQGGNIQLHFPCQ